MEREDQDFLLRQLYRTLRDEIELEEFQQVYQEHRNFENDKTNYLTEAIEYVLDGLRVNQPYLTYNGSTTYRTERPASNETHINLFYFLINNGEDINGSIDDITNDYISPILYILPLLARITIYKTPENYQRLEQLINYVIERGANINPPTNIGDENDIDNFKVIDVPLHGAICSLNKRLVQLYLFNGARYSGGEINNFLLQEFIRTRFDYFDEVTFQDIDDIERNDFGLNYFMLEDLTKTEIFEVLVESRIIPLHDKDFVRFLLKDILTYQSLGIVKYLVKQNVDMTGEVGLDIENFQMGEDGDIFISRPIRFHIHQLNGSFNEPDILDEFYLFMQDTITSSIETFSEDEHNLLLYILKSFDVLNYDINHIDEDGNTLLLYAVLFYHENITEENDFRRDNFRYLVQFLLERNADIDRPNNDGITARNLLTQDLLQYKEQVRRNRLWRRRGNLTAWRAAANIQKRERRGEQVPHPDDIVDTNNIMDPKTGEYRLSSTQVKALNQYIPDMQRNFLNENIEVNEDESRRRRSGPNAGAGAGGVEENTYVPSPASDDEERYRRYKNARMKLKGIRNLNRTLKEAKYAKNNIGWGITKKNKRKYVNKKSKPKRKTRKQTKKTKRKTGRKAKTTKKR
jgi:hypothetical protein